MMRKKISWLFLLTVFLSLFSCRNDYFPEQNTEQYNNASQFQVVKFSDIPQVARFIKLKTGRNDLKIPIKSAYGFSAEAKANIDFANLETNFIIKKTENNRVFYISNISNAGDENTLYNFEAREAGGSIVDARIIEYSSEVPFGEKPLEVLSDFTGRVRMYDLQGKETAGITFINGGETCDDNPTDPPSDSGGGGGSGGDDTPPPPPPGPPNWPQNPGPVYGGGDNGGSSGGNNGSSGSGNNSGSNSGTNCGSWQLSHYLYDGPCNGPACSNIVGAVFVNACNESMPVYLSQNKNSNYAAKTTNFSAPCGGNSGVVVVPDPETTPCEKIKAQRDDDGLKKRMDTLQGKTGLKKETGYIQKWGGAYVYKDNASATPTANSLSLPDVATNTYIKGFAHTHVDNYEFIDPADGETKIKIGIKNFSPADVAYFMDLIQNAQTKGYSLSDVYGVMISSGVNYQIRFTGNQYQIKTFTDAQMEAHRDPYTKFMESFIDNSKKLELRFLKYIDEKMNLKGITLYRMNADGTNTEIKLNADKTNTVETNCPN